MTKCRNCNNDLVEFMTFGKMPIANAFIDKKNFDNEYFFELTPTYCEKCTLFQGPKLARKLTKTVQGALFLNP